MAKRAFREHFFPFCPSVLLNSPSVFAKPAELATELLPSDKKLIPKMDKFEFQDRLARTMIFFHFSNKIKIDKVLWYSGKLFIFSAPKSFG